jgi:hypothetical protein
MVVSVRGKGKARLCQVSIKETNANKPLKNCRKRRDDVKTERASLARDKSERSLLTAQAASGMEKA